jgi:16S rRNA processing protein RimM
MAFNYLRVGKIVNTQGIKGEVRVIPLTEDINRFKNLKFAYLDDEKLIRVDIEDVKYHKNFVLLKFKDVNSINDAAKYKDMYILVNRKNAIKLPEGSYFVCDLIGLDVYDTEGSFLGKISDIMSTGSNDVYVINNGGEELLVPALKSVVKSISIEDGKIIVDIPEGLV